MSYPFNTVSVGVDQGSGSTYTLQPNPDTTGVGNVTQIMNAWNAGVRYITLAPTGTWWIKPGQLVNSLATGYYINAPGTSIKASAGAGDLFRMYDTSTYGARTIQGGGILGWPIIDGTATTGNSSAVHIGDIAKLKMQVHAYNWFSGTTSKGIWFDNNYALTEGMRADIYAQNCRTHVMFDNSANTGGSSTSSYDRGIIDITIDTNGVGDGVVLDHGAFILGRLGIYGNADSNASNSYAVLRLTANTSQVGGIFPAIGDVLNIDVENDDASAIAPQTINFGSSFNTINASGNINFKQTANAFTASNNTGQFLFTGPVKGDTSLFTQPSLGSPTFTQNITANGTTIFTQWLANSKLTGAGGFTGQILAAGGYDGQTINLINASTSTQTFAVPATSHVAQGTSAVLSPNVPRTFTWVAADGLWY